MLLLMIEEIGSIESSGLHVIYMIKGYCVCTYFMVFNGKMHIIALLRDIQHLQRAFFFYFHMLVF